MESAAPFSFIPPGNDIGKDDSRLAVVVTASKEALSGRWATPLGQEILAAWENAGFDRAVLDARVGRYYGQTDLRGVRLSGKVLRGVDLRRIDFFSAELSGATFERSDLSGSWLSESHIRGTRFDWTVMDGVLLDNVDFDGKTSFLGVDLNKVSFNLAVLLQDIALWQQRIDHLKTRSPLLARFLKVTCDYGRSFGLFLAWCGVIILGFSCLYSVGGFTNATSWFDNVYFSVVVFTTVGLGDISPISVLGKVLVAAEALCGFVMGGLLVAILARRIIGR